MNKLIAETTEQPSAAPHLMWPAGGARIRAAAVSRIALDDLCEGGLLLIQTANSVYSFSLADPRQRCGMLMGGRLGEASAPARLLGAQADADEDGTPCGLLATGLHAVFQVSTASHSRRLVTSAIKRLTYIQTQTPII